MEKVEVPIECETCGAEKAEIKTETVTGKGYGWKCAACHSWNWLYKAVPDPETTVCSTMHCYNRAEVTDDPLHPPFCEQCQDAQK